MVLPGDLEREEIIIDPQCDLTDYKVIGQEVTEILVMVPACFRVQRIIRRKWALKDPVNSDAKGVLIAPIPSRTIKRGLFDESILAHLLTGKFVDHLPLYRQKQIFERIGTVRRGSWYYKRSVNRAGRKPSTHTMTVTGRLVANEIVIESIRKILSEEFVCYGYQKNH